MHSPSETGYSALRNSGEVANSRESRQSRHPWLSPISSPSKRAPNKDRGGYYLGCKCELHYRSGVGRADLQVPRPFISLTKQLMRASSNDSSLGKHCPDQVRQGRMGSRQRIIWVRTLSEKAR